MTSQLRHNQFAASVTFLNFMSLILFLNSVSKSSHQTASRRTYPVLAFNAQKDISWTVTAKQCRQRTPSRIVSTMHSITQSSPASNARQVFTWKEQTASLFLLRYQTVIFTSLLPVRSVCRVSSFQKMASLVWLNPIPKIVFSLHSFNVKAVSWVSRSFRTKPCSTLLLPINW